MTVFKCKKDFFVAGTATAIFNGQVFFVEDIFELPMPADEIGESSRKEYWDMFGYVEKAANIS